MKTLLLCGLGALLGSPALGQTIRPDSSLLAASNGLHQHYAQALRDKSSLYNGPEYTNYVRPGTQGYRFFSSNDWQPAVITYGGETYAGVPARYDLVRDQLVLSAQSGTVDLILNSERLASFTLGGHTFVRLAGDSATGLPERPAFYDLLVEGPMRVLAARRKKYEEGLESSRIVSEITARTDYFLQQGRRAYPASKLGDVLRLFPQQRAALRSYAQANQLEFDEAGREAALVALVRYQATLGTAPK
ncbi:MAG: hypothetical protein ACRYFZ_28075 [Janthinobacterium lividum]